MKQPVTLVPLCAFAISALLASCGGAKTTVGSPAGPGPIPVGVHSCHFVVGGEPYGTHRCDVVVGDAIQLDKLSGMETFTGTLEAIAGGLRLTADMGCGAMVEQCSQSFTVDLKKEGTGWKGQVVPSGGEPSWWLAGATFEVDDAAGYGGATYGDAFAAPAGP